MGLLRAKNAFYTLHIPVLLLYKWTDHWLNGGGGGGGVVVGSQNIFSARNSCLHVKSAKKIVQASFVLSMK